VLVDFAFICDYAEVSNKINALGIGFDTIYASEVPIRHRSFSLVLKLRANIVEVGEKNIKISLIDEDGKNIIPDMNAKIIIPKPPEGLESKAQLAIGFDNVEFPRYGSYSIHVVVEGHDIVPIPIRIVPTPQPVSGKQ
jgi:hypothetical protein